MIAVDLVLALLSFTVYVAMVVLRPYERRELVLAGLAGAAATTALIAWG